MSSAPRSKPKSRPWQQGDDDPASFGNWLCRQREIRQIELAEIAAATKISRRYLEAFEQDRFDQLPAPIFAKGFLREYAKFIGVDPDEAVNHYLSAVQAMAPDEEDEASSAHAGGPYHDSKGGHWVTSLLIVLVVAGALLAVYFLSFRAASRQRDGATAGPKASGPAQTAPAPSAADRAPADSRDVVPGQPDLDPPNADSPGTGESSANPGAPVEDGQEPPADSMTTRQETLGLATAATPGGQAGESQDASAPIRVTLHFKSSCWVELRVDSRRQTGELRTQGESVQIAAERLVEMKFGDAGAVEVQVNGRPYSLSRGSGQVETARIDLQTVEALAGVS